MIKRLTAGFILWRGLTVFASYWATLFLPFNAMFSAQKAVFAYHIPYYVWIWGNFDGSHYMEIARNGYHYLEQPFFPLYPFLIWLTHTVTQIPFIYSALLISHVAFFSSLIIIQKLMILDGRKNLFMLLVVVILVFPTSFFYGSVYNDALFLFFATVTLYFSRKQKWIIASFFAALVTLTRLNGLVLGFVILFEYLEFSLNERQTWEFKKYFSVIKKQLSPSRIFRSRVYSIILIPAAFISYFVYTYFTYKNWNLIFSAMKTWGQDQVTFPLQVFFRYVRILILNNPNTFNYWVAVFELGMVLFYVFLMIYSYKRIRFSYWLFIVISIIIPSLTGTFQGMPRYALHLYPFFLSVSLLLEKKPPLFKALYFGVSVVLLFLLTALFTRGYFVS